MEAYQVLASTDKGFGSRSKWSLVGLPLWLLDWGCVCGPQIHAKLGLMTGDTESMIL